MKKIDERCLYKEFINKCIKENNISDIKKLLDSFMIDEDNKDDTRKEMNLHQINILIDILEEFKDNKQLQNMRKDMIIYRENIEK